MNPGRELGVELVNSIRAAFKRQGWNALFFLCTTWIILILVFMYRRKDISSGDFRAWLDAASAMKLRENPYLSSGGFFKSGPISPWYFSAYHTLTQSDWIFFYSLQVFNLLGIAYFAIFILKPVLMNSQKLYLITIFILLTSSVREILVDGQVTGLILGGSTFVVKKWSEDRKQISIGFLSTFPILVFLLDLKPNLIVPLICILILRRMHLKQVCLALIFYVFSLLVVTTYLRYNILYDWAKSLLNLNNAEINRDLYGSLNVWQILNYTIQDSQFKSLLLTFVPALTYVIAIVAFGIHKFDFSISEILLISLTIPFLYSYFHFYSYAPIIVGTLMIAIAKRWAFILGMLASFHLISFEMSLRNLVLSVLFCILTLVLLRPLGFSFISLVCLGWIVSLSIRVIAATALDNSYLLKSALVSLPAIFLLMFFYLNASTLSAHGNKSK